MQGAMRHQRAPWIIGFVATMVLLAGCGGGGGSSAGASPYTIGVVLSLTGPASFLGKSEKKAVDLLVQQVNAKGGINGHKLDTIIEDDQTDPSQAVQLTRTLTAQHVVALAGYPLVATCAAASPLLKNGPVQYCFTPGIHPRGSSNYVFSSNLSTGTLIHVVLKYFHAQGWDRVALIASTDASGQDGFTNVKSEVAGFSGMQLTDTERFGTTDVSVAAQLSRIAASHPQALIVWTTGTPVATVFKGIQQAGLNIPVATTNGNETYAQMQSYASFLPANLYFGAPEDIAYKALNPSSSVYAMEQQLHQQYQSAYGAQPDIAFSLAWDPMQILVKALGAVGPDPTKMRDYIESLHNFQGASGIYNFSTGNGTGSHRGLDTSSAYVVRWDATQSTFSPVTGADAAPLAS